MKIVKREHITSSRIEFEMHERTFEALIVEQAWGFMPGAQNRPLIIWITEYRFDPAYGLKQKMTGRLTIKEGGIDKVEKALEESMPHFLSGHASEWSYP